MAEPKVSKASVDYGPGHARGDHCGVCKHFIARERSCRLVEGSINAADWCKLFERKKR